MRHDPLKTTPMALAAVLLIVFAASFAHATPIEIDVNQSEVYVSSRAAEPQYEHLIADDEGYGGAIGADTYVSMQCAVGPNGSCFDNTNVVSVPEPGTLLMFATGMFLIALSSRRRRILARR